MKKNKSSDDQYVSLFTIYIEQTILTSLSEECLNKEEMNFEVCDE
jgi:hypothetical protein